MEKVIHCIWLGGEKTELARRCRASWERFAPDWEIVEHGLDEIENRSDVPAYVREALAAKKWAFASDWLRFVVLAREGGVYLDYDVELVAPMARLPEGEWVAAEWLRDGHWGYNPGSGIALEPGSDLAQRMLAWYQTATFGTGMTVGDVMSTILGEPQETKAICVLKPEVMSPTDWHGQVRKTAETIGIHHYALSWIGWPRRLARWLSWHGMDGLVQFLVKLKNG